MTKLSRQHAGVKVRSFLGPLVRGIANDKALGALFSFYRPKLLTRMKLGRLPNCPTDLQDPRWASTFGFQQGRKEGRKELCKGQGIILMWLKKFNKRKISFYCLLWNINRKKWSLLSARSKLTLIINIYWSSLIDAGRIWTSSK